MYVSSISGNISSYSTKRIHGASIFLSQLLCHLFHTPHAPHFHSCSSSIVIQTDIIYIVLSNPGSALHCVVSVTKAFRGPDWPCLWVNMSWCHSREISENHSELQSVQLKRLSHFFQKKKSMYSSSSAGHY